MDQQNANVESSDLLPVLDLESSDSSGTVIPGDNAGAYYGDYSEEIYRYIQQHDIGGNVGEIKTGVSNLVTISSRILIVILFFLFIFYAFKFIRLKGLDL